MRVAELIIVWCHFLRIILPVLSGISLGTTYIVGARCNNLTLGKKGKNQFSTHSCLRVPKNAMLFPPLLRIRHGQPRVHTFGRPAYFSGAEFTSHYFPQKRRRRGKITISRIKRFKIGTTRDEWCCFITSQVMRRRIKLNKWSQFWPDV